MVTQPSPTISGLIARQRRNLVLALMVQQERIARKSAEQAGRIRIVGHPRPEPGLDARYFRDLVMADGAAVISADHDCSPAVIDAARARNLRIITVGGKGDGAREGIRLVAADIPEPVRGRVTDVLVCTHGTRDTCCGSLGTRLWRDLDAGGATVRRTSHTGGHRFAPTAVTFRWWKPTTGHCSSSRSPVAWRTVRIDSCSAA